MGPGGEWVSFRLETDLFNGTEHLQTKYNLKTPKFTYVSIYVSIYIHFFLILFLELRQFLNLHGIVVS